jgi:hypothetical protein
VDTKRILDLSVSENGELGRSKSFSDASPVTNQLESSNLNLFMRPKSMDLIVKRDYPSWNQDPFDTAEKSYYVRFRPFPVTNFEEVDRFAYSALLTHDKVRLKYRACIVLGFRMLTIHLYIYKT